MRVLDKKLLRDTRRLYAQILAVALVMACGVATIITGVGAYRSLDETRAAFYERYHFASIFSSAVRAPLYMKNRISSIEGISAVELRVVKSVLLDVQGMREPATGIAISVPENVEPAVNNAYLRQGRMPQAGRANEVAVIESFANAHGFQPGDTFNAIMEGQKQELKIVGLVLSPEYIYAIGPGDMVPDPRRYGVFFMNRKIMDGLFDMEGAFNDVAITTLRDSDQDKIIEQLDTILKPYGGVGAYKRGDQQSHLFLDAELTQLKSMASIIPPIFLFVSAFLVNMILTRIIALEREQVGLLKAVGYSNLNVGWHYAKLVIIIALIGLGIGSVAGTWLGNGLAQLYSKFFSFPFLIFHRGLDLYVMAGGVTIAAALAGAAKAIWSIVNLPPAVAMRPPAPTTYRSLLSGNLGHIRFLSQLTIMALRHLVRWPVRNLLTTTGTALSVALMVTALFSTNSIDHVIDTVFYQAERQDATITFPRERGMETLQAVSSLPGVMRSEPFRSVPVILRNGHREERIQLSGLPRAATLSRVLDTELHPMDPPRSGIMLSEQVSKSLKTKPGDLIEVELLEAGRHIATMPVTAIAGGSGLEELEGNPVFYGQPFIGMSQSYVGMTAYMELEALNRIMGDGPRISGVRIEIDNNRIDALYRKIKKTPAIASIALQEISRDKFRDTINHNIQIMMTVYVVLSIIITFGVIYNSARIQLSERARELASLRVFGFTEAEVSSVLLTELGIIVLLAQPLGWVAGYWFSYAVTKGFESEAFRVPLVITPSTFTTASLIVFSAALFSALLVRSRIENLDLIRVLKTRD